MEAVQQLLGVLLVLGLLAASLWWLRRRGLAYFPGLPARRSGPSRMEHLERLALSPTQTLHLVRIDNRTVVIAASPGGCQVIDAAAGRPE
jgi:flagellar biogenesis protein FliO